ncbi:MAG: hypothetical protein GQ572_04185 [Gammaproteobacteria bacterium]|nr:hypothetical protein [Gammaproteobacteria bacterium]
MKNILMTIKDCDATTISSPILEKTIELANNCSSKVHIIHIVPPSCEPPYNVDSKIFRREIAKELRHKHDFLLHIEKYLQGVNIDATAQLVQGSIISTILQQSEQLAVDLVMLGHQQHSPLYRALMGDAIDGLLAKSSCPVMFVPI